MKRAYTQFSSCSKSEAKFHGMDQTDFVLYWLNKFNAYNDGSELSEEELFSAWHMYIDSLVFTGHCVHIFLPSQEFCDWLISCVDAFENKHVEVIARIADPTEATQSATVLHFPSGSRFNTISVVTPKMCGDPYTRHPMPDYSTVTAVLSGATFKNAHFWCWHVIDGTIDISDGPPRMYAKLICGLGMYLSCFPEMRREGLPDDLKHPSQHQYKESAVIGISEKVTLGGTHDSPTPHFRVGHFRFLKSEQFTKKRFQTVFVHECFVKGRAETVLEP